MVRMYVLAMQVEVGRKKGIWGLGETMVEMVTDKDALAANLSQHIQEKTILHGGMIVVDDVELVLKSELGVGNGGLLEDAEENIYNDDYI